MAVLTEHAVCVEVKPGPYSAATDKEFALWAQGGRLDSAYLDGLVSSVKMPML